MAVHNSLVKILETNYIPEHKRAKLLWPLLKDFSKQDQQKYIFHGKTDCLGGKGVAVRRIDLLDQVRAVMCSLRDNACKLTQVGSHKRVGNSTWPQAESSS